MRRSEYSDSDTGFKTGLRIFCHIEFWEISCKDEKSEYNRGYKLRIVNFTIYI